LNTNMPDLKAAGYQCCAGDINQRQGLSWFVKVDRHKREYGVNFLLACPIPIAGGELNHALADRPSLGLSLPLQQHLFDFLPVLVCAYRFPLCCFSLWVWVLVSDNAGRCSCYLSLCMHAISLHAFGAAPAIHAVRQVDTPIISAHSLPVALQHGVCLLIPFLPE
jgi:hypothetical protein